MSHDTSMLRTYRYRLYPRKAEIRALETLLAQGREVYNAALAECKLPYQATGKGIQALAQWDSFRELLEYKAESAGTQVIAAAPHYTSQVCRGCGAVVDKDLSVRTHECPHCGLQLDRDVNAARNILHKSAWTEPSGANVDQRVMRSLRSFPL